MTVAVSRQTREALDRFMRFFGIDDYNLPLFSEACSAAGVESFARTFEALDKAIASDNRNGTNLRIRRRIAEAKSIERSGAKSQ